MIRAKVLSPVITAKIKSPTIRAKVDTTIVRLIDLGMSGATVGNIAIITAVDEFGRPTGWAAVDPVDVAGLGELIVEGDGNALTDVLYDHDTRMMTFEKGATFFTQEQVNGAIADALAYGVF